MGKPAVAVVVLPVYVLDMTDEMLKLANKNKEKIGVTNVDFIKGYILLKVGFKKIEIEPVHVYTKSVFEHTFLNDKYLGEVIQSIDLDTIDGAFAGAYIKAKK